MKINSFVIFFEVCNKNLNELKMKAQIKVKKINCSQKIYLFISSSKLIFQY